MLGSPNAPTPATTPAAPANQDSNAIETIQSLIVAFVLAMIFRGFITEGFVIPTGSMAPTLLGRHSLFHSEQTGSQFAVGLDQAHARQVNVNNVADPMLGPMYPGSGVPRVARLDGTGDRILVLKSLYPFAAPKRFDVVVFKNPTDPTGEAANYIKRLVGLPNEQVWLADGDVFARPLDGDEFRIQRKPEHVQRAVWQPVFHSDHLPVRPQRMPQRYLGTPWSADTAVWDTSGRSFISHTTRPTVLEWDHTKRVLNDWVPYNMLAYDARLARPDFRPTSDLRIAAGIVAEQAGLHTTLELQTRGHIFEFTIQHATQGRDSTAIMRMRPIDGSSPPTERTATVRLPEPGGGRVFNVEFWHVDQAMHLFIDGRRVMPPLEYEWSPLRRLQLAVGETQAEHLDLLVTRLPLPPVIRWRFEGSPVALHRVRVDRDLHYRHAMLDARGHSPHILGHAFGTHPNSPEEFPGILGPDHFMMCGDNSQMSLDSRLWGRPHPLVAHQIDEAPFVVNRRLLIGKAWVVYFPALYPLRDGGTNIVPDFGRLRFIR
jgi:signal peptidase I